MAKQYAKHLEENLRDLHDRLRNHRSKAPPVERVWIDKGGEQISLSNGNLIFKLQSH